MLLFPLCIGRAVDGLLKQDYRGLIELGALCLAFLLTGAGRRFYDTRVYARVFRTIGGELIERETKSGAEISRVAARTGLLGEVVDFLENSLPELIEQIIGFVGILIILLLVDSRVFALCLAGACATIAVYALSEARIIRLNKGQNDELERQVDVLASRRPGRIDIHLRDLMRWRVKLSDLETLNFGLIWIALAGTLLGSIVTATTSGDKGIGAILSIIMYVFQFIEAIMAFPFFYQQWLRLREIGQRLG